MLSFRAVCTTFELDDQKMVVFLALCMQATILHSRPSVLI